MQLTKLILLVILSFLTDYNQGSGFIKPHDFYCRFLLQKSSETCSMNKNEHRSI